MDSLVITNKMVQKTVSIEDVIECVENTWRWYGEADRYAVQDHYRYE